MPTPEDQHNPLHADDAGNPYDSQGAFEPSEAVDGNQEGASASPNLLSGVVTRPILRPINPRNSSEPHESDGGAEETDIATSHNPIKIPSSAEYLLKAGTLVDGKYRIQRNLGHGGMGLVYLAYQENLDRQVALKIIRPTFFGQESKEASYARLDREAKLAAQIRNPHVVEIYDSGVDPMEGFHYIAMEYVDGSTLKDILQLRGKLSEDEALIILLGILDALKAATSKKIVHRDIKPENIMISKGGEVKLLDLGISKQESLQADTLATTHHIVGTPGYIAPEQIENSNTAPKAILLNAPPTGTPGYIAPEQIESSHVGGFRADIYSLGITLYQMLTGKQPFRGKDAEETLQLTLSKNVPDPRRHVRGLRRSTVKLLQGMTARNPAERFMHATSVMNFIHDNCEVPPKDTWQDTLQKITDHGAHPVSHRRGILWGILAILLLAALSFGAFWGYKSWMSPKEDEADSLEIASDVERFVLSVHGLPAARLVLTDSNGKQIAEQTADKNGYCVFKRLVPGEYHVTATRKGYQPQTQEVRLEEQDLSIQILQTPLPPHALTIQTIPGAHLILTDSNRTPINEHTADANGSCVIPELLPDEYRIAATMPGYIPRELPVIMEDQDATIRIDLELQTYVLTFQTLPETHLTLLDENGNASAEQTAGENGVCPFERLLPGEYRVTATRPGYIPREISVTLEDQDATYRITLEQKTYSLTIQANPSAQITLQDHSGNPIAELTANGDGFCRFEGLLSGGYRITATMPGYIPQDLSVTLEDQDATRQIDLARKTYTLTILATAGAQITLQDSNGNPIAEQTADGDAPCVFTGLLPDEYRITATLPGYISQELTVTLEDQDATRRIDLAHKTYSLTIQANPGAQITLQDHTGNTIGDQIADGNGSCVFTGLLPNEYRVTATLPGYIPQEQPVTLEDQDVTRQIDLARKTYALTIQANPGARITLQDSNGNPIASQIANENDSCVFTGLLPGEYRITAALSGYISQELTVTMADQDATRKIELVHLTYSLTIQANPGAQITLQDHTGNTVAQQIADGNGLCVFTGLLPNEYRVAATLPGYISQEQSVSLADRDVTRRFDLASKTYSLTILTLPGTKIALTDSYGDPIPEQTTGGSGSCVVTGLLPGVYHVTATLPGYIPQEVETRLEGMDATLSIKLTPQRYALSIQTTPGAHLVLTGGPDNVHKEKDADGDGICIFGRLLPGRYHIEASKPGYIPQERDDRLEYGDCTVKIDLARKKFTLTVQTAPDAHILLTNDAGEPNKEGTADARGYSVFKELPSANYHVTATLPGYLPAEKDATLEDRDATVSLRLVPQTYALSIQTIPGTHLVLTGGPVNISKDKKADADADGFCVFGRLLPGEYHITASLTGYITQEIDLRLEYGDITLPIKLERLKFALTVRTAPGTHILLTNGAGDQNKEGAADASGSCVFRELPPGNYHITATLQGYLPAEKDASLEDRDATVSLKLIPQTYTLSVQTSQGTHLVLTGGPDNVRKEKDAGGDGVCIFGRLLPGRYHLEASKPGYLTQNTDVHLEYGDRAIPVELARKKFALTVRTTPGASILLTNDSGEQNKKGTADANGNCVFRELPSGNYHITAKLQGYLPAEVDAPLEDRDATVTVRLDLQRYALSVQTSPGTHLVLTGGPDNLRKEKDAERDGFCVFGRLLPGKYHIMASLTGYAPQERDVLLEAKDTAIQIDLELQKYVLTIQALPGTKIVLTDGNGSRIATETVTTDACVIQGLLPGTYHITATMQGYLPQEQDISLQDSDTTISLDLALRKYSLAIHARPGTRLVLIDGAGKTIAEYTVQTDGSCVFEGLVSGKYRVAATLEHYNPETQDIQITGANASMELLLSATMYTLKVKAQPGTRIALDAQDGTVCQEAYAQGDGFCVFGNLTAGKYTCQCTLNGYDDAVGEITLPANDILEISQYELPNSPAKIQQIQSKIQKTKNTQKDMPWISLDLWEALTGLAEDNWQAMADLPNDEELGTKCAEHRRAIDDALNVIRILSDDRLTPTRTPRKLLTNKNGEKGNTVYILNTLAKDLPELAPEVREIVTPFLKEKLDDFTREIHAEEKNYLTAPMQVREQEILNAIQRLKEIL